MEKLWLVTKREYISRVLKKSFILTTLVTPLAIALFMIIAGFLMNYEGAEQRKVAVIDTSGILGKDSLGLKNEKGLQFIKVDGKVDDYKRDESYDAILELPPISDLMTRDYEANYYSSEGILGIGVINRIEEDIEKNIFSFKRDAFGFDKDSLRSLNTTVGLERKGLKEDDEVVSSSASVIATGIGGAMGFIMYFAVFMYGMMVMKSVTEEKTNRIVEIMVSSVKPFYLLMGKILGVGLVGLTQVAIWAILIPVILTIAMWMFGMDAQEIQASQNQMADVDTKEIESQMLSVMTELKKQNWLLIIPLFLIYFLGGYMMYSSLFAAVGSATGDDLSENQSLMWPITLPVIIAFYIMFSVVQNPGSSLATWSSMFPLFSPIVMPARLAFEPPWWEIVLSVAILIASVIFFVWLSGRIYRVGILMYGKKVTLKELGKWLFYKE